MISIEILLSLTVYMRRGYWEESVVWHELHRISWVPPKRRAFSSHSTRNIHPRNHAATVQYVTRDPQDFYAACRLIAPRARWWRQYARWFTTSNSCTRRRTHMTVRVHNSHYFHASVYIVHLNAFTALTHSATFAFLTMLDCFSRYYFILFLSI